MLLSKFSQSLHINFGNKIFLPISYTLHSVVYCSHVIRSHSTVIPCTYGTYIVWNEVHVDAYCRPLRMHARAASPLAMRYTSISAHLSLQHQLYIAYISETIVLSTYNGWWRGGEEAWKEESENQGHSEEATGAGKQLAYDLHVHVDGLWLLLQIEFYFGNANLQKDRFLQQKMKEHPDGCKFSNVCTVIPTRIFIQCTCRSRILPLQMLL